MIRWSILSFLCALLSVSSGFAAYATPSQKDVEQTLASYRKSRTFKAKVKKTITQELMGGEPSTSEGDFYYSKGRLRLQINTPEPSTLVYDGQFIWFESRLSDGSDEKIVVTKVKSQQLKKSDSLLAALFGGRDFLKLFKMAKAGSEGNLKNYDFVPKEPKTSEVQSLALILDSKNKEIKKVTYTDTVENKVEFEFSETEKTDVPKNRFQYEPPKGADITEL